MKDPAFLFYSSDFLSGTMLMSDEQVGQYIKLLCLQHQKGHLKEKDMLNICKAYDEDIFSKFKKDEQGNYYNQRLEDEVTRRKKYSESRRNNRKKKDLEEEKEETYVKDMKNICNSYEKHMGTETATVTITKNINNNINNNNKTKEKISDSCIDGLQRTNANDSCVDDLQKIIDFYNNNIGAITPYGLEVLSDYAKDMSEDLIMLAMKKAVEANKRTIQYIKGILNNWERKGIKTVIEAQKEDEQFRNRGIPKEETEEEKIARKIKELEAINSD